MPTTDSHSLPYPSESDPADVPADIGALAEAVDAKLDDVNASQITGATSGQILVANSSGVVTPRTASGDVTVSNTGVTAIGTGAVTANKIGSAAVTTAKIDDGAVTSAKLSSNLQNAVIPSGSIFPFAGNSAPTGYLICDGSPVSRSTYSDLFSVCGTTYGAGDGSTTFNLPNLKGRMPVGLDSAQTEFDARGKTGGAKTHTLSSSEMPSHTHSGSGLSTSSSGSHTHSGSTSTDGSHTHSFSSPGSVTGGTIGSSFVYASSTTGSGTTGADGSHSHSLSISSAGDHTHSISGNTSAAGSGSAHNNLQPYLVVNYIIRA